jgi:CheY-like chemotaxis protein
MYQAQVHAHSRVPAFTIFADGVPALKPANFHLGIRKILITFTSKCANLNSLAVLVSFNMIPMASHSNARQSKFEDAIVLCVDDDEKQLGLTKLTLERNGYSVLITTDWRRALDLFSTGPIDLVIVDYEMPDIKGNELAVWIRGIDPQVPIVLHSGAPNVPENVKKTTDAFIAKDAEPHVLMAAISNLIMKRRVGRNYGHPAP